MMNLSQGRVVDPILTAHVQGYKHPQRVGSVLFPPVGVGVRAGKVIEFDKASFKLYNARRAPGTATKQVDFGHFGRDYQLEQDSLAGKVPRELLEEANAVPGVDLNMRSISVVMQSITLLLEYEQAKLAKDPASYPAGQRVTVGANDKWSNPAVNPLAAIEAASDVVADEIGMEPNVLLLGRPAWRALKNNPEVKERFKYTGGTVTTQAIAALLELEKIEIGKAVYTGPDDRFVSIWGNVAVLAYAPQQPGGQEEPSFGYTYTLKGHPFTEQQYFDNDTKSWISGVTYDRRPVLTGMSAGYLFDQPA